MINKEKAKRILTNLYNTYSEQGLLSIYLWGSVITDDYKPLTSDIDTIAIIDPQHTLPSEKELQIILKKQIPEVPKFGFRFLTTEELSTGKEQGNFLSQVIYPRILLGDLPYWEGVIGQDFVISDFTDNPPTSHEMLLLELDTLSKFSWNNMVDIADDKIIQYYKTVFRIIYYLQGMRDINKKFSYSEVEQNANITERDVVAKLNELKESDYSREVLLKHGDDFESFTQNTNQKYRK